MKKLAFLTLIISVAFSTVSFAGLTQEIWDGANAGTIEEAWAVINGDTAPTSVAVIGEAAVNDRGVDYYVQHLTGFVVAPADGDYTFHIASDDNSELLIDGVVVASVAGWAGFKDWGNGNCTPSEPMTLTAGQVLSVEAAMNEGTGGDNLAIGWLVPGSDGIVALPDSATFPTEAAMAMVSAPSPADGAVDVVDAMLTWAAPLVGEAPAYDVSFGTDPEALECVAAGLTETAFDAGTLAVDLDFSTTYYWSVSVDGGEAEVWSFTTADPVVINSVTGDAQLVGAAAQVSVDAVSPVGAELTYQWHRLNFELMPGFIIDDAEIPGAVESVYAIDEVAASDQGDYYCIVTSPDGAVASAAVFMDAQTGLIHQWTFNESADGVTIPDVVGGADATLVNLTGLATIADGQATLGNDGSQASNGGEGNTSGGDFVDLPNGLISGLTQMTLELWTTWGDNTQTWARVYDIGTSNDGEGVSPGAGNGGDVSYFCFFPKNGGNDAGLEYRWGDASAITSSGRLPGNEEVMLTQVTDDKANRVKLYVNGVAVGGFSAPRFALSTVNDNNVWLGRSQWGDPLYVGSFNELRLYDTVLSAEQIAADYLAGPDAFGVLPARCTPDAFTQIGDLNDDCVYDFLDAAMYADRWLTDSLNKEAELAAE